MSYFMESTEHVRNMHACWYIFIITYNYLSIKHGLAL
jgi:hypothetical protein